MGPKGSAYDPVLDTIFIGMNASKGEAIHEIRHAIDSSGAKSEIYILKSDKLLNGYRGRLYIDDPLEVVLDDETINIDCMHEFVSVAVEQHFENAERVKKKNYDIIALVGALNDAEGAFFKFEIL